MNAMISTVVILVFAGLRVKGCRSVVVKEVKSDGMEGRHRNSSSPSTSPLTPL